MATVNIPSLKYQPVGPRGEQWAAQVALAVSTEYVVGLQNAVTTDDRAIPIAFAVVDNIAGSTAVTVIMANLTFAVPPFTREVLSLPAGLQNIRINVGTGGGVTLTVSDGKPINDQTNFLSIQQTAAATLTYQFVNYSANAPQAAGDLNKTVLFTPVAANMAYTLLLASIAGNGWLSFIYNQGTKTVSLTPTPPNTLNGSAAAIVLNPGDSGILQSDGSAWYFMDIAMLATIITTLSNLANAAGFLKNDGAGVLSWDNLLAVAEGGTGLNALGAALQVLRVNAAGNALEYGDAGGETLIGTLAMGGGTQTLAIPAGYRSLLMEVEGFSSNAASAALRVELSSTGGAAYGAPGSVTGTMTIAADTLSGIVEIFMIGSTVANAKVSRSAIRSTAGNLSTTGVEVPTNTAAIANFMRVSASVGTADAGTIRVYGVK